LAFCAVGSGFCLAPGPGLTRGPFVRRVVIANPLQVRAIAHAKDKTDKIDAAVLAKLHASGFMPEVWMPDEPTETLRRLVAHRSQVVQQMTRAKNWLQGVLHAN